MRPILRGELERRVGPLVRLLEPDVDDMRHAMGVIGLPRERNNQIVAVAADAAQRTVMNFFARIDADRHERPSVESAERRQKSIAVCSGNLTFDHAVNVGREVHAEEWRRSRQCVCATSRDLATGRRTIRL
ncbi:MAG: hypothetical protein ACXW28_05195 [Thermoanaerobaculia bacterium]